MISTIIDFILHIDQHLAALSAEYGVWIYAILFLIIFCETGLVVTPFLPGDSLYLCRRRHCRLRRNEYSLDGGAAFGGRHFRATR